MIQPDFLSLPGADDVFTVAMSDGARLPVYALRGPQGAPALLFGHANGFAAGSYAPWLALLAQRLHIFAFDARGHGGSTWPDGPLDRVFAVDRMAEDLVQVARAVAEPMPGRPLAYAGHSLGGASALRLALAGRSPGWAAMVIFEPPISPPPGSAHHEAASVHVAALVEGTLKRRTHWPSRETMRQRLAGTSSFARFRPDMLEAHCRATLRPAPEGGYRLCCPPPLESFIYGSHAQADSWARLPEIVEPVHLVRGDPALPQTDGVSAVVPDMAARMPQARLTTVAGTGHMLILEQPERCAELVWEGIAAR